MASRFPCRFKLLTIFGLLGSVLAVGLAVREFLPHRTPEWKPEVLARMNEDPRQRYRGPFLNVHAAVKYVGMERCGDCHADVVSAYSRHSMARSLRPVKELARSQAYDEKHHNPFPAFASLFRVDRQGERVWHREIRLDEKKQPIYQFEWEPIFAIGSGKHGHSYLGILGDGYLVQTPISWFAQKSLWDISPGFAADAKTRRIRKECLFCHAGRALPREGCVNRYELPVVSEHAIGCERCHGPGELHVKGPGLQAVAAGAAEYLQEEVMTADFTIVNPGKLKPEPREAVCQQCHLEGKARVIRRGRDLYDFRPGLALEDFWSVFVHAGESGEDKKAVNHVEQMYLSRCFQRSQGQHKLGCTSCHDPHQPVGAADRASYYRQRCLGCHAGDGQSRGKKQAPCSLSPAPRHERNQDNCLGCHMPPYAPSDIVHAASTDHRIVRRLEKPAGDMRGFRGEPGLVHFQRGRIDAKAKDVSRDLGIALVLAAVQGKEKPTVLPAAIDLLERALQDFPDDLASWETKSVGLWLQKRFSASLAAAQVVLSTQPGNETALEVAATSAQALGKRDMAMSYWKQTVKANPWRDYFRKNLALLLVGSEAWPEAAAQSREWLRLDPANIDARKTFVECLLRTGKRAEAIAEFAKLEALRPDNLEALKSWLAAELKAKDGKR